MRPTKAFSIFLACAGVLFLAALAMVFDATPSSPVAKSQSLASPRNMRGSSGGTGSAFARVDSQVTLRIPEDQADAVYRHLKEKYVGKRDLFPDRFPGFDLHGQDQSDVSIFTDRYFDTPDLDLFAGRNSARHRFRINTTDPKDRKSGRELVQVKVTPPGSFELRGELKYRVNPKPPKKASSIEELHPLIRLIPKQDAADFLSVFRNAGLDPFALQHTFTIRQTRGRVYINLDKTNIVSFSVDVGRARVLWATAGFASVDVGLVENAYTDADDATRKLMWEIRDAMVADLKKEFPDLAQNDDSKYGMVMGKLIAKIGAIRFLARHHLLAHLVD